jgi:predicted metal-dependent enzyme (double-stranded beta helix superfamily)
VSGPAPPSGVLEAAELVGFAVALAGSPERWRHLTCHAGDARTYETIWSDEHVNAWVIRWADDSDTGFHDHDVSAAGIVVLEGSVIEQRLALAGPPVARRFGAGQSFHLSASAIHRVRHDGAIAALTIHAYSPPLRRQGVYRTGHDGALERDATPYTEELHAPPLLSVSASGYLPE